MEGRSELPRQKKYERQHCWGGVERWLLNSSLHA